MKLLCRILTILSVLLLLCLPLTGCDPENPAEGTTESFLSYSPDEQDTEYGKNTVNSTEAGTASSEIHLDKDGTYTSREDVKNYLIEYHTLPDNFITKKEAKKLGWPGGSLEPYAPGKCIGGDRFGNYEGALPDDGNVTYHECDIDTLGAKSRGAKRIVYSDDGQIYYTEDHYETFTLIYEEENESWN